MLSKIVVLSLLTLSLGHSASEWQSRTIYQVIIDRFARNNGDESICQDLHKFCGGGFKGLQNNLDYIQNMGFDAIWISPVVQNVYQDGSSDNYGYHGYWAQDFYSISSEFGGEDQLKSLIAEMHKRGMWIMLDVVANHVGPIGEQLQGVSSINPFNQSQYYHPYCPITNWNDLNNVENCWLADLPDLNQSNDYVRSELINWIKHMVTTYDIDGIRIDTCVEVPPDFWTEFTSAAGVYSICEVDNGSMSLNAMFQGPADATLNYPLFFEIRNMFAYNQSLQDRARYVYNTSKSTFSNIHLLGNFVDNHDNARFLSQNNNINAFKSALAWSMTYPGIPIVYYGDEQGYAGGNDPYNREILWTNLDNTKSDMYQFVTKIVQYRKELELWNQDFVERYALQNFYCFTRGKGMMCFTNNSSSLVIHVTYHPYAIGDVLCNIFYDSDCVTVTSQGVPVYLNNGEVKLYKLKGSQMNVDFE